MKITMYSDGGSRGNPGPAAIGAVLFNEKGDVIDEISRHIGKTTNNQAEYQALLAGMRSAEDMGATEVECFLDSELVVKQLNGEYKVKDKDLAVHFLKIWNIKSGFKKAEFKHVRREKNKHADALVNKALDRQ